MEEYQKQQQSEDTKPHERLGFRVNDKQDQVDMDEGVIQEHDQGEAFG